MMLLASLLAAAAPQPSELKQFQDWAVGCDNGRACQAVALVPEPGTDEGIATMSVRRGAEPGARPAIAFTLRDGKAVALAADGRRLAVRLVDKGYGPEVVPGDAPALISALRTARSLQLLGADGSAVARVSLAGSTAALLYMDEQQKGGPQPLPVIRAAPRPTGAGLRLSAARLEALRVEHHCTLDEVGGPDSAEFAPIDRTRTLVLLACGSGAYNVTMVPFIAERWGRDVDVRIASFDISPQWWDEGRPALINAGWDAKRGRLLSFSKGRGLGDCGTDSEFVWDGVRFRLVRQADMDECRGSTDYITTWRARVVQR